MTVDIAETIAGAGPLSRQLNQLYTRFWHEVMSDFDVTGPQYTALVLLVLHGPIDQGTLGGLASLDKSTAAPLLARLRDRELVAIERDSADKRRKVLCVTDRGRAVVADMAPLVTRVESRMLGNLSSGEGAAFLALARRVVLS
ncbi:MarR family transcriptional regulator [Arthrobacter sp. fls2-241-R2A-172]|uniref:MarR family winged helix-turn-helix transcriptional regulator n=1 Tax=Arthrobacter sp. fls2-241-R2A-172 TaxID=3040325 RepID=UPI00254C1EE7|nr:MarR family transcriptional regulator [Arthrobacter sp. fls2-241-R2A-172]